MRINSAADMAQLVRGAIKSGGGYVGYCPAHDDRQRSLSFGTFNSGKLSAYCFAGCTFRDIMRAVGADMVPAPPAERIDTSSDPFIRERLEYDWLSAQPVTNENLAGHYLTVVRKLGLQAFPDRLRFHATMPYWVAGGESKPILIGEFPALLARVESVDGQLVGLHRTYLDSSGSKLNLGADYPARKLRSVSPGATKGAAIRLHKLDSETLAVAEGIETALAAHVMSQLPVWATVTAVGMEHLQVPETVREVIICGDNDRSGRGQEAAAKLASRLHTEGRQSKVLLPPVVGTDWADVLKEQDNARF